MRAIYDTILWLQAQTVAGQFPIVQFSADTDMPLEGWVSLTSINGPEIVVTQLTGEEYCATFEGIEGYLQAERRVNSTLGRSDLRCSWLVRVEEVASSGRGSSFAAFYKDRVPPKLIYRDILGNDTVAEVVRKVSLSEFEQDGGKIMVLK